jgi:hypothetical protein
MNGKSYTKYLIIAGDGRARITTRYPYHLKGNEIAYRVSIIVPAAWGRIMNEGITLTLPDNPPTVEGVSDL